MEGLLLRLYGVPGCPSCEAAAQFLLTAILPPGSVHFVPLAGDPILVEGIKAITGRADIPVPILVSFVSNPGEIVVGWREFDYDRIVKSINFKPGAGAPNIPATQGGDSASTTGAPGQEASEVTVSAAMPGMPGSVGSGGSSSSSEPN